MTEPRDNAPDSVSDDVLPVTKVPRRGLPGLALVVGDPARADAVAARLTDARLIGENREYRTFRGTWRGVELVVSSHGVGGPGAVCLFAELAEAGVHTLLRYGTTGALRRDIQDGDLVIAEAAVRDDGVSQQLVHPEFPAFATPEATLALAAAAREHGARHRRGVVWTRAAFSPGVLTLPVDEYVRAGVLAIEMEMSALYVFAALRGLRAGGALVVDGYAGNDDVDATTYAPHRQVVVDAVRRSADVVLDALVALQENGEPA
ncbi:nucleoside phosphorylase [Actinoalloteichus hymeniacidonis]|uniref:Uridine phosphorylase n=1 Tax=Actinoalloteichus hymeniacidonis TaxID=340345 RepID=A0AAC9MYE7_9PSEU|nr:nucleoside phosphorylase [Actinoalloteichus hymeniacidonis]AOS63359.1 uridine phosphorylase [Actinoalloteichus hymeniacidonis]MBB5908601.1 uridine phosphorylase [Actinoalloteichus hymeniacidonis]